MRQIDTRAGLIRRLLPSDFERFRDHLLRLDAKTRRDRFSAAVSDSFLETYAARGFAADSGAVIFGHVAEGAVHGVAELCQFPVPDRHEAEAAFTVEPVYRRRGIGTGLFRRALLAARNRGVATLHVRCLPENRAMQSLARRHGARLLFDVDETLGKVEACPATPFSVLKEFMETGFGAAVTIMRAAAAGSLDGGARAAPP
jgi:GNAT superfamily N-acetyltransferase